MDDLTPDELSRYAELYEIIAEEDGLHTREQEAEWSDLERRYWAMRERGPAGDPPVG